MFSPFHQLSPSALIGLAEALSTKRLLPPFHPTSLDAYIPSHLQVALAHELEQLHQNGMSLTHITALLRLLANEKTLSQEKSDRLNLVWTGQGIPGLKSRATSVVVQELFNYAYATNPRSSSQREISPNYSDSNLLVLLKSICPASEFGLNALPKVRESPSRHNNSKR